MVAPVAKKLNTEVFFGKNPNKPDEFRGENAMDPPIVKNDPYFWMQMVITSIKMLGCSSSPF